MSTITATEIALVLAWVLRQMWAARSRISYQPVRFSGETALLAFGVWSSVITVVAPLSFRGVLVLNSVGDIVPLGGGSVLTISNIAQVSYIWLGIVIVLLFARDASVSAGVIELALAVAVLLNVWAVVHQQFGVPFPEHFFDNSPNYRYISTAADGSARFRGIAAEPSALAGTASSTIVFAAASFAGASRWRRLWLSVLFAGGLWLGVISTSTTFVLAVSTVAAIAVLYVCGRFILNRNVGGSRGVVLVGLAGATALVAAPGLIQYILMVVNAKVDSTSFDVRSGSDNFAFNLAFETLGLGAGVGANRSSSVISSLLGQVGVPGLCLYGISMLLILRGAASSLSVRPVLWVAIAMFVGLLYNGPDLGASSGIFWPVLGVLARASAFDSRVNSASGAAAIAGGLARRRGVMR